MLVKEKHKIATMSDESTVQETMKVHMKDEQKVQLKEIVEKEPAPMA